MAARSLTQADLDSPVAGWVNKEFVALRIDETIGESMARLRGKQLAEKIVYFYVVDAQDVLKGVVSTRRMLMGALDATIESVMFSTIVSIRTNSTVMFACELFVLHKFLSLPVIDDDKRLIGTVDVSLFTDEVFSMAERRARDDVFQLIGVHLTPTQRVSPTQSFRGRFPWLMCNIGGGLMCALLSGQYEDLLGLAPVLAVFIPVVLALAESVSVQSLTITLQTLHDGVITSRRLFSAVRWELAAAAMLGVASGGVVGIVSWIWKQDGKVGFLIGLSICLSMITASLLGVLMPAAVRMLKRDPKIASGPIVLATADLCTLLFYFTAAQILFT